jgi:hypothetical protein
MTSLHRPTMHRLRAIWPTGSETCSRDSEAAVAPRRGSGVRRIVASTTVALLALLAAPSPAQAAADEVGTYYRLTVNYKQSTHAFAADGSSLGLAAPVQADVPPQQRWDFTPLTNGTFQIRNQGGGLCLRHVRDGSVAELATCAVRGDQMWRWEKVQTTGNGGLKGLGRTKFLGNFNDVQLTRSNEPPAYPLIRVDPNNSYAWTGVNWTAAEPTVARTEASNPKLLRQRWTVVDLSGAPMDLKVYNDARQGYIKSAWKPAGTTADLCLTHNAAASQVSLTPCRNGGPQRWQIWTSGKRENVKVPYLVLAKPINAQWYLSMGLIPDPL